MDKDDQELLQQSMQQGLSGHDTQEHSGLNLRPKTMFDVKGRARPSDTTPDNYLPQWSKDGDGFKKQFTTPDDRDRRKNKVIRYTREELLAMHVVSSGPPDCPEGTPVIAPDSLPPVANIPFDYEEIYKQWAANKDRNRQPGRGRGQPRADGNTSGAAPSTNNRTNNSGGGRVAGSTNGNDGGRRASEDMNDPSTGRKWNDKRGGDDSWQRGARMEGGGGDKDDLWDDVDPLGGEFKDMGLSNFAEAAEIFRREMDEMHRASGRPDLRQQNTMESEDQFADSVEEEEEPPMWDMPSSDPAPSAAVESADLSSWSTLHEQPAAPLHVNPVPVDAWFYLDPQGLQQGPFKSAEMREWFEAGYFKPHLPIRFGLEGEFASLANHFRHGQIPFSTVPSPNPSQHLLQQQKALQQQQQLLLQKQQLEQQQFLANQLQQQRLLEQRRLQEEQQRRLQEEQRIRLEMQQRIELQEQAVRLAQQQQQQQQLHFQRQNVPGAVGSAGAAIGSGWGRPALPRDNIISGARDSMMGGLGMFAAPPQPAKTEFAAPSWDTNDDTSNSSLWNSTVTNDPELGSWDKPTEPEPSASWGASAGWGVPQPEAAPQASPKASWGLEEPSAPSSSWGNPDTAQPMGSWSRQSSSLEPEAPVEVVHAPKEAAETSWEASAVPETPSLKQIQKDEQEEMRRRLKKQTPQPTPSEPQPPQAEQQPHLADMGQQLKRMLGVSNPSPPKSWGSQAAAPPAPVSRSLSLRDIQAEEERLAQLKRQEKPVQSSSRWSSVVTGSTHPTAPSVVAARPAPVDVKPTPPKDRDASFWNFDASSSSPHPTAVRPTTPGAPYNSGNPSDDLLSWASKQVKKLGGAEDLIQYCATLEDPGEIREYLAAYLGSTPKVSAFATEFIQKKKQLTGKKQSAQDAKAATFQKKVGSNKHLH